MAKKAGRTPTFTDDQIASALRLYEDGEVSLKEAAASIGISVSRLQLRRAQLRNQHYPSSDTNYKTARRYRITDSEYRELVAAHGGKCALCDTITPQLVVDHDHRSGAVRGMLCYACNNALGWLEKWLRIGNDIWLGRAIAYIDKHAEVMAGTSSKGRPPTFSEEQIRSAKEKRERGASWRDAAASINISVTRLQARIRDLCPTN